MKKERWQIKDGLDVIYGNRFWKDDIVEYILKIQNSTTSGIIEEGVYEECGKIDNETIYRKNG